MNDQGQGPAPRGAHRSRSSAPGRDNGSTTMRCCADSLRRTPPLRESHTGDRRIAHVGVRVYLQVFIASLAGPDRPARGWQAR